jgi:hypothetical protein
MTSSFLDLKVKEESVSENNDDFVSVKTKKRKNIETQLSSVVILCVCDN